jgi:hypothetical protein
MMFLFHAKAQRRKGKQKWQIFEMIECDGAVRPFICLCPYRLYCVFATWRETSSFNSIANDVDGLHGDMKMPMLDYL